MPNPVRPTIAIVGEMQQEHYSVLGRVICAWSSLELRIAHTVALHSDAKVRSILFAFQNMTTRGKLETAGAIISVEGHEHIRSELMPLIDQAAKLAAIRHVAAHSVWLGITRRGHMVAVDIEARRERAQIGRVSWSKREFEDAVSRINNLTEEIKRVTDNHVWEHSDAPDFDVGMETADYS